VEGVIASFGGEGGGTDDASLGEEKRVHTDSRSRTTSGLEDTGSWLSVFLYFSYPDYHTMCLADNVIGEAALFNVCIR
jgi:hypothetical protein